MFLDLTVSSFDYLEQVSALMRDPILCGADSIPRGGGEPVLLRPDYFAGDWAMARWLRRDGSAALVIARTSRASTSILNVHRVRMMSSIGAVVLTMVAITTRCAAAMSACS